MKLSKKSLMNALILATEKTASFMFAEAQNALQDGTLEIDGYVRADNFNDAEEKAWIRYIPDEPRTHPEPDEFVLTCMKGDMEVVEFKAGAGFKFYNEDFGWRFVNDPYFPLFWRHSPKPPKEFKNDWKPLLKKSQKRR